MMLLTVVTWLRAISLKQPVLITYKYDTDTVEKAGWIVFELPGYCELVSGAFTFFITSPWCHVE